MTARCLECEEYYWFESYNMQLCVMLVIAGNIENATQT